MTPTPTLLVRRFAPLAALALSSSVALWAATKGPDAGGYSATDETIYSFADISGAGGAASVLAGTDDGVAPLALPFAFQFYGQPYGVACVSTNGALYFVPSAAACTGFDGDFANTDVSAAPVPNDRPAILPFWSDLTFQVPGAGAVLYQTLGTAPNRRFVVQWHNAFPQGAASPVTFQAILVEGSNSVLLQYRNVSDAGGDGSHGGAHATVGVRNAGSPASGQSLQWSFNAPVVANASALLFSAAAADTTPPTITVVASPSTLRPGDHDGKPGDNRGKDGKSEHNNEGGGHGRDDRHDDGKSGRDDGKDSKLIAVGVKGAITDAGSGVDSSTARYTVTDEYGAIQPAGAITVLPNGQYTLIIQLQAKLREKDTDGRRYTIAVTAKDKAGNSGSASTVVTVVPKTVDKMPPRITVVPSPSTLRPGDEDGKPGDTRGKDRKSERKDDGKGLKLVAVGLRGTITDAGSGVDSSTARYRVTDEYGTIEPAGAITVLANGQYMATIQLQANVHDEDKDGRKYTIVVTAKDKAGNSGSASISVTVVPKHEK